MVMPAPCSSLFASSCSLLGNRLKQPAHVFQDVVRHPGGTGEHLPGGDACEDEGRGDAGAVTTLDVAVQPISDHQRPSRTCLLYTSDAADDLLCVDLGGRR